MSTVRGLRGRVPMRLRKAAASRGVLSQGLRKLIATAALLAVAGCGGRVLIEDGLAGGGQSTSFSTGGAPVQGGGATTPQAGASTIPAGGSSSTSPGCTGACAFPKCTDGLPVTLPGQCCPVCVASTPPASDAGVPSPPAQCLGLTANPPTACPLSLSDLACNTDSDCTIRTAPLCAGCMAQIYGVNRTTSAMCGPRACPPQEGTCATFQYQAQDCQVVPKGQYIVVGKCVGGECFSFAEPTPGQ
jgi:hypothetical protein